MYPITLNIENRKCVIIGGGKIAYFKAGPLLEAGAEVTVVSPEICTGFQVLEKEGKIRVLLKEVEETDYNDAFLIIVATNSTEVNERVYENASESQLVNVISNHELGNFHIPATLNRGMLSISVSTNGASPTLEKKYWLSWQIGDRSFAPTTDRGDASGTCYFDATANRYRNDLVELALGHDLDLPRVAAPSEVIGYTPSGIAIAPGTGDNMAGGLGLGVTAGAAVISVGTSGTAFTKSHQQTHEPTGTVAGFADATGEFLPLVCTLNGARNLVATAEVLGVTLDELSQLALSAEPGSQGVTLCAIPRG